MLNLDMSWAEAVDHLAGPKVEAPKSRKRCYSPKEAKTYADFDLVEGWQSLPRDASHKAKLSHWWTKIRGFPTELLECFLNNQDVAYAGSSWDNYHQRRLVQAADKRSLLFLIRDRRGYALSASARFAGLKPSWAKTKVMALSNSLVGSHGGARIFGDIRKVIEGVKEGRVNEIHICEGAPDTVLLQAIYGEDCVLGGVSAGDLPKVGKALARFLAASPKRIAPEVILWPDRDTNKPFAAGELKMLECGDELRRWAHVSVATVKAFDDGKGDVSDMVAVYGLEALERTFEERQVLHTRWDINKTRRDQDAKIKELIDRGTGVHVICGSTGTGKTTIAIKHLLKHVNTRGGEKVLFATPTKAVRHEVALKARKLLAFTLGITLNWHDVKEWHGRDEDTCSQPARVHAKARIHHEGAKRMCTACADRSTCGFFQQLWHGKDAPFQVVTHSRLMGQDKWEHGRAVNRAAKPPEILIIDESPIGEWISQVVVSQAQLSQMVTSGAIKMSEPALNSMLQLMSAAAEQGKTFGAAQIRNALGEGEIQNALKLDDLDKTLLEVDQGNLDEEEAPAWVAPTLMASCSTHGWLGCTVTKAGELMLASRRELPKGERLTLYMDATITKELAEIMWPGCTFHDFTVPLPSNVTVTQVKFSETPRSLIPEHIQNRAHSKEWRERLDGEHVLHGMSKAMRDNEDLPWLSSLAGKVDHYKSTTSKGSNKYEQSNTFVAGDWHVPRSTVNAFAAQLHALSPDTSFSDCQTLAQGHFEFAEIQQFIGRIRPYAGTEDIEIWIFTKRRIPGLTPNRIVGVNQRDKIIARLQKQFESEKKDSIYVFDPREHDGGQANLGSPPYIRKEKGGSQVTLSPIDTHGVKLDLSQEELTNHFCDSLEEVARCMGVRRSRIKVEGRAQPMVVFHMGTLSEVSLRDLFTYIGVKGFQWGGRTVSLVDCPKGLLKAVRSLWRHAEVTVKSVAQVLNEARDVKVQLKSAERQVRRILQRLGQGLDFVIDIVRSEEECAPARVLTSGTKALGLPELTVSFAEVVESVTLGFTEIEPLEKPPPLPT